jgi:hypothetical protein
MTDEHANALGRHGHVLWTPAVRRKLGRMDLPEPEVRRFLDRLAVIMAEFNEAGDKAREAVI